MLAGEALSDSDSVLTYTTQTEPVSGFTLLLSQPRVFTGEMTHLMVVIGVALGTVSLLLCLWGALVLSRQVTRPVREMTAAMKRVQMGELSARVVAAWRGRAGAAGRRLQPNGGGMRTEPQALGGAPEGAERHAYPDDAVAAQSPLPV